MAVTRISDILTPDAWNGYGINRTRELSALWESGIVTAVPGINLPNGGGTVNIPHFNALTGDAETLSDSVPLTPASIGSGKQVAVVVGRGRAWGVNDLAGVLAGADPARALMDQLAKYWAGQMQADVLATLKGVFGAATMSGNVLDISAAGTVVGRTPSSNSFIDATQLLGDAKGSLKAIAMHSATEAFLAKANLIVYERPSDGSDRVAYYQGKRVIVDDGLPVAAGTYTTYLFGAGVIGAAEETIGPKDLETDRAILAGDTLMTMRRRFILHVQGTKWVGPAAGAFPTRAELAAGAAWQRVFDPKAIPVVAFSHKLA